MANYTVFDNGRTLTGSAEDILTSLRERASVNSEEIRGMSVDQYADALIEDAPYFLDDELFKVVKVQDFATKFDRALAYIALMPSSGVRIMTVKAA